MSEIVTEESSLSRIGDCLPHHPDPFDEAPSNTPDYITTQKETEVEDAGD
jgi:hypothetical protein